MGHKHGVRVGDRLAILDPLGDFVGTAQVVEVLDCDANALAPIEQMLRAGYFISRS
ncbi:MAG: hypothetical protein ACUVRZ_12540 [Desulfobacca sp.]|uniref:hypothetical protein n=1 Tax=Desulfobacca sp. TaxID=2067990 RepID=UPI00404A0F7F